MLLGLCAPAFAQVNAVPQVGLTTAYLPKNTYSSSFFGLVPGASATDVVCIAASSTKTVRVQRITIGGTGTAVSLPISVVRRASLDTGGTAATSTALPVAYALDSANAAASAIVTAYTANPTINDTAPGILDNGNLGLVATTVGAAVQPYVLWDYAERNFAQAPLLRTAAQQFCVNLNVTSPTALVNVTFRWTEAPQ
jgi:hypothetical protein